MIEFWFITIFKPIKMLIMKKSVNPFMLFAFLLFAITTMHGLGCKKNSDEDCRTCKAFGGSGLEDEETVCSESEETAFRNANQGKEIMCQ
jgi:hypothetical protein